MTYEEARNLIDEMRAEIKAKHICRSMDGECTSEEVAEYRCRFAALSMAIEALERQRWIPCSKELPPKPEQNPLFEGAKVELYLVSEGAEFYPFRAFWNGKDFTDGFCKVDAAAWMPLPKPYKAGE